jgi:hypothetical protein
MDQQPTCFVLGNARDHICGVRYSGAVVIMQGVANKELEQDSTRKFRLGVLGFLYALFVYQIPASITAAIIAEADNSGLHKASILVQFAVGLSLSVLAYCSSWDRSFKLGMRAFYGMLLGLVFALGAYSILTSF